jgi:MFS family permease
MTTPRPDIANRVRNRVMGRLMPYLILLYVVAYLDRVNVSYAALEMTADLGFTAEMYGLGAGIFFLGYFLLEVPGAVIAQRWGVRVLVCRIMITWGVLASAMGFIQNAQQFYWLRFLIGAAEAGFFPAMIVYLGHWRERMTREALQTRKPTVWQALCDPRVLIFSAAYFFGLLASNGLGYWLPTMIKSLSGFSNFTVGLIVSLPYSLGVIAKVIAGWSSDRTGERRWHTAGLLLLGGAGLAAVAVLEAHLAFALLFLCIAVIGLTGYTPSFWAYATSFLAGTANAAAIGLINSIGNLGSFAGPYAMGWLKEHTTGYAAGVWMLAASSVLTALLVLAARRLDGPLIPKATG